MELTLLYIFSIQDDPKHKEAKSMNDDLYYQWTWESFRFQFPISNFLADQDTLLMGQLNGVLFM